MLFSSQSEAVESGFLETEFNKIKKKLPIKLENASASGQFGCHKINNIFFL